MSLEGEWKAPDDLVEQTMDLLEEIEGDRDGDLAIGVNETTKAVERNNAKLVLIARNVEPKEIVMHLPILCKEKDIEYIFVELKEDLGKRAGINVGASSVAITDPGEKDIEFKKTLQLIREAKLRSE